MYKKLLYAALLVLPAVLMANGAEGETSKYFLQTGRETDFIPRIFNFSVFAGLLYYLVASPIKDFFRGRREDIAKQLNEIESKLQEAKDAQKSAEQALVDSKAKAKEIVSDSKREMELLSKSIQESNQRDLQLLDRQFEEKIEHDERRMVKDTINSVLNEGITADDIPLTEDQVIEKAKGTEK